MGRLKLRVTGHLSWSISIIIFTNIINANKPWYLVPHVCDSEMECYIYRLCADPSIYVLSTARGRLYGKTWVNSLSQSQASGLP